MVHVRRLPTLGEPLFTNDPLSGELVTVRLSTPREIKITGDLNYSVSFDGSSNVSAIGSLPSISTPGTFNNLTINEKGLVTSGSLVTQSTIIQPNMPTVNTGDTVFWIKPEEGSYGLYMVTGE